MCKEGVIFEFTALAIHMDVFMKSWEYVLGELLSYLVAEIS